jgi:cell division septal protein FtsQ
MAKKSKTGKNRDSSRRRAALRIFLWLAVAAAVAGAGWVAAVTVWDVASQRQEFRLDLQQLTLKGCPEWVNSSGMTRQLRDALAPLPENASLFRKDIAHAVQHELRSSPWLLDVREVRRILPNQLQIRAVFRRPAGIARWDGRSYLVDQEGHWLPDELFSPPAGWAVARTPAVVDHLLREPPPIGWPWDGARMAVGARLTDFLRRRRALDRLDIRTIDVTGVGRHTTAPEIVLTTAQGVAVKWGKSSVFAGVEGLTPPASGPSDVEKLQMLLSKLAERPRLQGIQYLDLRFHGKIIFNEGG